jgi:regulator of protease activity HflC (stomatin/prohibitin superfamily)
METRWNILYRPMENHVGVIYRCGRFNRFADPDHWTGLFPLIDTVEQEVPLDIRITRIQLQDVYTSDPVAVDLDLKIFYVVDLRRVAPELRMDALRLPGDRSWDQIVHTSINDIARNTVCLTKTFDELNSPKGREYLKIALSAALHERVKAFGILVKPRGGVGIVDLQPNAEFRKALMENSAAEALGAAAVSRLGPFMEQRFDLKQEKAVASMFMQIASAIVRGEPIPAVLVPNPTDHADGGISRGSGQGSLSPNIPGLPPSQRQPKSVAGD